MSSSAKRDRWDPPDLCGFGRERPAEKEGEREKSILMNWIEVDTYVSKRVLAFNPKKGDRVPGPTNGPVTVIRFYGVDENGCSTVVHVHGFVSYFYSEIPSDYNPDEFIRSLDASVADLANKRSPETKDLDRHVLSVEIVQRQNMYGYFSKPSRPMLMIRVAAPSLVRVAQRVIGLDVYDVGHLPHEVRYMVERDIVGCNWLELPFGTFLERPPSTMESRCQREFDITFDNVQAKNDLSTIGKFRVLSFDIECEGRKGHFPEPEKDPVIQIGNRLFVQGTKVEDSQKILFVLGECSPIHGTTIYTFQRESDMLTTWSQFVRMFDPDILTGYNIQDFDMPYLLKRAATLGVTTFPYLGRIRRNASSMSESSFSSSAFGTRKSIDTNIDGRVMVDMIKYMFRSHKLSSYSLNAVSAEFLGQQKDDIHHSMISVLHKGTNDDRARLGAYCLKDAYLPLALFSKFLVLVNYAEMARVTGVPMTFLFTRGQQVKVLSMIYRRTKKVGLVMPSRKRPEKPEGGETEKKGGKKKKKKGEDDDDDGDEDAKGGEEGYQGATVLEPKCALYDIPIATLDFASLYPSIMRARNLCYTTFLTAEQAALLPDDQKTLTPAGFWFVKPCVRVGLLPSILEELLTARSQAKKDMKNAVDDFMRDVMNGRQSALKVSANSVYGFTGATIGALPCLAIAASVTAYGREMIEATKKTVEEHYTVADTPRTPMSFTGTRIPSWSSLV